jgi:hypothetical protein
LPSSDISEILELKGIDIFYLEGDKEMLSYAKRIQRQLINNNGLDRNKIIVGKFSKEYSSKHSCQWSTIRYDPEEESAARKIKPLVEKIVPSIDWNLLLVNTHLERSISENRISLFLENNYTFNELNPTDQSSLKLSCETFKR